MKNIPSINNFDLIRFLAAVQVLYMHSMEHLKIDGIVAVFYDTFLQYFPGVPIFFTVSGFLIFRSFDLNNNLKKYIINRTLRLFPALCVCIFFTALLLIFFSSQQLLSNTKFYLWVLGQISIFQFYTPDILRFWGVGTPNGSLWTISVEIQFYILVPIVFIIFKKLKSNIFLFILIFFSILLNIIMATTTESIPHKLFFVSVVPYLFNFLSGAFFYVYWEELKRVVENKFLMFISIYMIYFSIFGVILNYELYSYKIHNIFQIITPILLSVTVLSFAFSFNNLSEKILKNNDISYGIYIYHMLIVNTLIATGYQYKSILLFFTLGLTLIVATLSWKTIEKPSLRMKNKF